jgi:hypothetical protein
MKGDLFRIDGLFTQEGVNLDHILNDFVSERGGARLLLEEIKRGPFFPEEPKGRELKEIWEVRPCRRNDLFDLKARADGIDDGTQNV